MSWARLARADAAEQLERAEASRRLGVGVPVALFAQYSRQVDALTRALAWQQRRLDPASTTGPGSVLSLLVAVRLLDEAVHQMLGRTVSLARRHGASWSQIGSALGISRQSAHERFAADT